MVFPIPLELRLTTLISVRALALPPHGDMAWWSAAALALPTSREITPRTRHSRIRPLLHPLRRFARLLWPIKLIQGTIPLSAGARRRREHRQLFRLGFRYP